MGRIKENHATLHTLLHAPVSEDPKLTETLPYLSNLFRHHNFNHVMNISGATMLRKSLLSDNLALGNKTKTLNFKPRIYACDFDWVTH